MVEDEPVINQAVTDRLRGSGYDVVQAWDGPGAVEQFAASAPDLVLLDVMLPGFDGHEVCRRIQARRPVPVLMLTARDDEADILVGLGVGADDYLTKPFRMRELVARVAALLRRVDRAAELATRPAAEVGDLRIDAAARRVWVADDEVHLTPTEFDLLLCLAAKPGDVLTQGEPVRRGLGLAGCVRDPHCRQPREGAASQDRRGPGANGAWGRLRPRARVYDVSGPVLDQVTSVKVKLGLLVAVSVTVASIVAAVGAVGSVPAWLSIPVTVATALGVTQLLAVGMTSPLREMTAAARGMARGDYSARVTATSSDEVGELARAFNRMADDLAAVDRQRRELVANVSHELRTPLAALCAVLENLVDGVAEPDPVALRTALDQAERLSALASDLLDLARVDAGAARLSTTQVPVLELLERAVAEARVVGREVRYDVRVTPADLTVPADPARLHQLIANLLDNASRHSPAGGVVRAHRPGHGCGVAVGGRR